MVWKRGAAAATFQALCQRLQQCPESCITRFHFVTIATQSKNLKFTFSKGSSPKGGKGSMLETLASAEYFCDL